MQSDRQDCHCSKGENYFESTLHLLLWEAKENKLGGVWERVEKWIRVAAFRHL